MGVTVGANGLSIVHKGSGGEANATLPDVCLTKVGKPIVPIPYGNNAKSADLAGGTTTISMDGGNSVAIKGSTFSKSTGDAGGDKKGVASGTIEAEAKFISASPTVKFEGKGVCRLSDQMTMNKANTMCLGGAQNPSVSVTEDQEGTYTVDVYVPNLSNANFVLKDNNGASVTSGKLDSTGRATVSCLKGNTIICGEYEESPDAFVFSKNKVKLNSHHGELSHDQFFDVVAKHERPFWEQKTTSRPEKYTWGLLAERAYPNKMLQQLIELEARQMSPKYSKYWSEETLATSLLKMLHDDPITLDDTRSFVSNILAIQNPELSLMDEAYAFYVFLWMDKKVSPKELWAQFRNLGTGNPQEAWSSFDWEGLKQHVNRLSEVLFKRIVSRLEAIKVHSELMSYNAVGMVVDSHIDSFKRVQKQLPDMLNELIGYCKDKTSAILAKGGLSPVVKANYQSMTNTRSLLGERYLLPPQLSLESINGDNKLFVFAKSCEQPSGCNDAGDGSEHISNFGDIFHFSFISSANANPVVLAQNVMVTQSLMAESTTMASSAAVKGAQNALKGVGRSAPVPAFSFKDMIVEGQKSSLSYLITASALSGFSLLHRTFFEDETQLEDNELQSQQTVSSRVRMKMSLSKDRRYPNVTAFHANDGIMENIPVKRVNLDQDTLSLSVALDARGTHITWTPIHEGEPEWRFTPDHDDSFVVDDVLVTPLHESEDGDNVETYPSEEPNWEDAVLVFPVDTGIPPLYIVYSKKKPPVTFIEVGLYKDFEGRPRLGKYEVDHMPSAAAIERYLKTNFGDQLSDREIKALKKRVASIVIPKEVHRYCSETYGGRNSSSRINLDSENLESAVESNFSTVAECLQNDFGVSEEELSELLEEMHRINKKEGWY
ncbi:PAAR-like domain-containing protein [Vibrio jasicida]|uniref:PAAR-like domain-containing protein n=1 Tax=Vibrio jasicida TaxID=766224 RepID=UPI00148C7D04|nr:PAAR-like domain-containing protein [Vibrio jasicida]NOJ19856.1 DUF4150 domain-containing protein [Vibrio jasicida]